MQSAVPDKANTRRLRLGPGSRLPGGRHFKTFAMYTCSRGNPMASSMELSSCPARPTKGSPRRSSSAPGASPTMSQSACRLPTPNTVCVRVALKGQRVHAATRALSSPQSAPASRRAAVSPDLAAHRPTRSVSPDGSVSSNGLRAWRAASKPQALRQRDILAAARYSCVGAAGRLRRRSLR